MEDYGDFCLYGNDDEDDGPLTWDKAINQCGGHTEDAHQQVTDGQVQDEEISDWAHVVVLDEHQADESVPHHTQQQHQHQQVEEDVADRNPCRVDVIRQQRAVVQSEVGSIVIQGHFVHFGS